MKKFLLAAALSASVALGGCASTGTVPSSGGTTDISSQIAQAQQIAVQVCGYLPVASTVSALFSTFVPGSASGLSIAAQVANAICNAVAPTKSARLRGAAVPTVNGVPIVGRFVR